MKPNAGIKVEAKIKQVDMIPADHLTMKQAVEKLNALGHVILKVDHTNRKITVKHNG